MRLTQKRVVGQTPVMRTSILSPGRTAGFQYPSGWRNRMSVTLPSVSSRSRMTYLPI